MGETQEATLEPQQRLIWSAGVPDEETLMARLDAEPRHAVVKIDRLFLEGRDLSVIDRLRVRGIEVFDDAKLIQIPSKLESLARKHARYMPAMLNCMVGGISNGVMELTDDQQNLDGLKRFADVCHLYGPMPVGVTVLTSKTDDIVEREFQATPIGQVLWYVERLLEAGFGGVVCSPKEVAAIRTESRFDSLELLTPGVRSAGNDTQDQARTDTPQAAIEAGATRVISGRQLTDDQNHENYDRILAEITVAETAQTPT